MLLLESQFAVNRNHHSRSVISATPFLGGVLHGVFENLVQIHAPIIGSELGITPRQRLKHYAILPPPFGWQIDPAQNPITLKCGFMLYGQAEKYSQTVDALLKHWHEIRFEGHSNTVDHELTVFRLPGMQADAYDGLDLKSLNRQFHTQHTHPASHNITLHFYTPLRRRNHHPPQLLHIVRSVASRIRELEPLLADSLGLASLAWIEAEEQARRVSIARHRLTQVEWLYRSRSHQHYVPCTGLLGQMDFTGAIPATIMTLLHWGQWFGAGQSAALGQGMYYINEPLIHTPNPPRIKLC